MIWLPERLAPFRRTIGTTGGLVAASALTSGTGFVFWWIAARQYPQEAVGLAAAAVSAMLLLSQIAVLGLGTTLVGVLPREERPEPLVNTALLAAGMAGALLGLAFGLLGPLLSPELRPIAATPLTLFVFGGGVSVSAVAAVLDQVLIAVSRNFLQLLRNAVFSFGRLAILIAAASLLAPSGMAIYAAWLAGVLISLAAVAILLRRLPLTRRTRPLMWGRLRELATGALSHHLLTLSRSSSIWLLPLLVTVVLSSEANASFYIALLLANFIALVTASATFTLYVAGARAPELLWRQVRFTLAMTTAAAVGGTAILALAGQPLLTIFGGSYAEAAYPTVALLALGTIPLVVKDHWIAVQRLRGGVVRAAVIGVGALVAELIGAAVGALLAGLEGLAVARLGILLVEATFMAPAVYRAVQRPPGAALGPAGP